MLSKVTRLKHCVPPKIKTTEGSYQSIHRKSMKEAFLNSGEGLFDGLPNKTHHYIHIQQTTALKNALVFSVAVEDRVDISVISSWLTIRGTLCARIAVSTCLPALP